MSDSSEGENLDESFDDEDNDKDFVVGKNDADETKDEDGSESDVSGTAMF